MPGVPGIFAEFERRQGSDALDTTSSPVPPPTATHAHSNNVPEIGGSEGGFIGLIVGLAIIFIGSCVGVFFLLRNWHHGGRTVAGKSGEVGKEAPPGGPGFPRRRGTLFGFSSGNPRRSGWVRAPGDDDDEWDADDTLGGAPYDPGRGDFASDPVKLGHSTYAARSTPRGEVTVPNLDYTPRAGPGSPVEMDVPGHVPLDDPFVPPVRSASPVTMDDDSLAHYPTYVDQLNMRDGQDRHMSLDSAETVVTLPGGTKFKEEL